MLLMNLESRPVIFEDVARQVKHFNKYPNFSLQIEFDRSTPLFNITMAYHL